MSVATLRVVEKFDIVKDVASGLLAVGVDLPADPLALR